MPRSHGEYGRTVIREAVGKGYVERTPTKKAEHKGRGRGHVTMNHITPHSKQHLKGLPDD
ncbi:MAG: hypothetical protein M3230_07250 [Thermoproteota archaeon]|nr:hypothetical protein [Thermoproteota archaeon]